MPKSINLSSLRNKSREQISWKPSRNLTESQKGGKACFRAQNTRIENVTHEAKLILMPCNRWLGGHQIRFRNHSRSSVKGPHNVIFWQSRWFKAIRGRAVEVIAPRPPVNSWKNWTGAPRPQSFSKENCTAAAAAPVVSESEKHWGRRPPVVLRNRNYLSRTASGCFSNENDLGPIGSGIFSGKTNQDGCGFGLVAE